MPKKIFNSDLETSGQVLASTLTDGTATLSGGVFTASTLTDGTATLNSGRLRADFIDLTGAQTSTASGLLTATAITDGTATLSGGVLTASTVTATNYGTVNAGTLTGVGMLIPDTSTNTLHVRKTSGAGTPVGITISKPYQGAAFLKVMEEGSDGDRGLRIVYQGDAELDNSAESTVEDMKVGTGTSATADIIAFQALEAGNVHNVISFNKLGEDFTISSSTISLAANKLVVSDFEGAHTETISMQSGSSSSSASIRSTRSLRVIVDSDDNQDNNLATSDLFSVEVTNSDTNSTQSVMTLTTNTAEARDLANPDVINLDSTTYLINKARGLRMNIPHTGVPPAAVLQASDGFTALRGGGDIHFTIGNASTDSTEYSASKFSFRRPAGYGDQGRPTHEEEVAYISSSGSLHCTSLVSQTSLIVRSGSLLLLANDGNLSVPVADTTGWYNLVVNPGGLGSVAPNNTSVGTIYADSSGFTGVHRYLSEVDASLLLPGNSVALNSNNRLELTTAINQPNAVGIIGKVQRISDNEIAADAKDSLGTDAASSGASSLVFVLSVGDTKKGAVRGFNVCNENGDIQPGDLLVTSSTPGYLMKQDDDIVRSKTVGKAMEAVTFDDNGQATGIYGFIYCG